MKYFDLHCDTLGRSIDENTGLYCKDFHVDFLKGLDYKPWVQCLAIFIPDEYRKQMALNLFTRAKEKLEAESSASSNINWCKNVQDLKTVKSDACNVIFTVEGGAALAGNLKNLYYLHDCNVKMMTLTWNGKCEIGDGAGVEDSSGLTGFGKKVVREMEKLKMIVDISHASDRLFYDVAENTEMPFVASHSNSRSVCRHKRNLNDEQFKIIKYREGLVGLNFCKDFLASSGKANMYDIIKHADYFLSLGGESVLCMGSDFDGTDMPEGITGIESIHELYELFLKSGYKEKLVEDIFFNNAYNFFIKHI